MIRSILQEVVSRVWVVYLFLICGFFFFTDYKTVIHSARLQTLSRLTPSFDYSRFRSSSGDFRKDLGECVYYHQRVADFVPSAASQALSMAGYCAARLGHNDEALTDFQKSIEVNPEFFWNYYNRGVLFWRQGKFDLAGAALSRALNTDPKATVYVLMTSKVFNDISRSFRKPCDIPGNLAAGYRSAMELMRKCQICWQHPETTFCQDRDDMTVQMF